MTPDPREPPTIRPKRQPYETVIVWMRFLTAASLVLAAVAFLASEGAVRREVERQIQRDPGLREDAYYVLHQTDWVFTISFGAVAVVYLCLAVLYAVIGVFNRSTTARVTGWFLAWLGLLCCGPVSILARLIEFGTGRTLVPQDTGGRDYSAEANQMIDAATPVLVTVLDWFSVLMITAGSLLILILPTLGRRLHAPRDLCARPRPEAVRALPGCRRRRLRVGGQQVLVPGD